MAAVVAKHIRTPERKRHAVAQPVVEFRPGIEIRLAPCDWMRIRGRVLALARPVSVRIGRKDDRIDQHQSFKALDAVGCGLHHGVPAHGMADADYSPEVELIDEGCKIGAKDSPIVRPRLAAASVAALVEGYCAVARPQGCCDGVPATGMEPGRVGHNNRLAAGISPLEPDDLDVTHSGAILARFVQSRIL